MAADSGQSGSKPQAGKPPKSKTAEPQAGKPPKSKTAEPQATGRNKPVRKATGKAGPSEPVVQAAPPQAGGPEWLSPYPPSNQPPQPGQAQATPPPYWYPPAVAPGGWPPPATWGAPTGWPPPAPAPWPAPGAWPPPPGTWPPPGGWPPPATWGAPTGWPPPAPAPWPAPGAWPPPPGTWQASPPPAPPAGAPPQEAASPVQPAAWPPPPVPAAWGAAPGSAAQWAPPLAPPWGYGYPLPPAEPPPPSGLHPPVGRRPLASLAGRAAPRLYAAGWILSLGGLILLVALIAAASAGLSSGIDRSVRLVAGETSLIALTAGLWSAAIAQSRQRRADGWEDYFGPSPLLATVLLVALSWAVATPVGEALDWLGLEMASSVQLMLALLVNLACYVALTHRLGVHTGALTWSDIARPQHLAPTRQDLLSAFWSAARPAASRLRRTAREVGLGAGLAIPAMIGTLILLALVMSLLGLRDVQPSGDSYEIVTDFDFWIVLVSLAVVAPIGEEIFFRGLITNAWARSLARKEALLRATVLFASIHILNNGLDPNALGLTLRLAVMAVVVRLPVAWLLCWAYTSQRSIIASISLHGAYNGGLVLLSWWASHQQY